MIEDAGKDATTGDEDGIISPDGDVRQTDGIPNFRPGEEEFSAYFERVELYFGANGVAEHKKVPIFLNSIGGTTYGLLRSLTAPDKPQNKSLDDLASKLKAHFETKYLVITELFHFLKRNQNGGESVSEYLAELHRMAARCSFGMQLPRGGAA